MDPAELITTATELLGSYGSALMVDPFCRIKPEISEGDYVSKCEPDVAALTWVLKLNPVRHSDLVDIQYSVIEACLKVLFYPLEIADPDKAAEARRGLISRLTAAIVNLTPLENSSEGDEHVELD